MEVATENAIRQQRLQSLKLEVIPELLNPYSLTDNQPWPLETMCIYKDNLYSLRR